MLNICKNKEILLQQTFLQTLVTQDDQINSINISEIVWKISQLKSYHMDYASPAKNYLVLNFTM